MDQSGAISIFAHINIEIMDEELLLSTIKEEQRTSKKKKEKKRPNWCSDEIAVLQDLATEYSKIIDQKYDDRVTKEKKRKVWSEISKKVSLVGHFNRSPNSCKRRWQNQKSNATNKVRAWAKESRQTGTYFL